MLEYNWELHVIDNYSKLSISKTDCIIITGYYGGLEGEKIGKAHLGGIREYWLEGMSHPDHPHIPLILTGLFKGKMEIKCFCLELVNITIATAVLLMILFWIVQLLLKRTEAAIYPL